MAEELTLKICFVGDDKCGKTSLVKNFIGQEFSDEVSPFDENLITKEIEYNGSKITLNLMDPLDDGTGTTASFYNHANAFCALFDLTDKDSIQNCKNWLSYGERYIDNAYVKMIIGCKSDLEHAITKEEGEEVAKGLNCEYDEVSCKSGENCKELYDKIITELYDKFIAPTVGGDTGKKGKKEKKPKDPNAKKICTLL
jgi:small GTP-binding protein